MARERDDEFADDDKRRPRRRDNDDDAGDRPARRRDRDDDDRESGRGGELGPLDKMYRDTNMIVLVIFGVCCSGIAAILSAVCYFTAKDSKAKSNALIVMIIGAVVAVLWVVLNVVIRVAGAAAR